MRHSEEMKLCHRIRSTNYKEVRLKMGEVLIQPLKRFIPLLVLIVTAGRIYYENVHFPSVSHPKSPYMYGAIISSVVAL